MSRLSGTIWLIADARSGELLSDHFWTEPGGAEFEAQRLSESHPYAQVILVNAEIMTPVRAMPQPFAAALPGGNLREPH